MTRRETRTERNQQDADAEHRAWELFRPKLEALQSYAEAEQLVTEAPPPDSPGRGHYTNLGFFLGKFTVPMGSSYAEKMLYLQFIQRLDNARKLNPGTRQKIEEELLRAMKEQGG